MTTMHEARAELGAWARARDWPALPLARWAHVMAGEAAWRAFLAYGGRGDLEMALAATRPRENPATPPPVVEPVVDEGDGSELALPW